MHTQPHETGPPNFLGKESTVSGMRRAFAHAVLLLAFSLLASRFVANAQSAPRLPEDLNVRGQVLDASSPVERAGTGSLVKSGPARLNGAAVRGSPTAKVTIVEFSDFQCPFCAQSLPTLQQLLKEYDGKIKLVFKHFPLEFHSDALLAHQASLAAGEQGNFWEMHDRIYASQRAMKRNDLIRIAQELGLKMDQFLADLESERLLAAIEADKKEAFRLGVNGTPTFLINGRPFVGARPLADFRRAIEEALRNAPGAINGDAPKVSEANLVTGLPDAPIEIVWFADLQSPLAPQTSSLVREISNAYPRQIRVVFKHAPMVFHPDAFLAHEATMAADAQGKRWEMQDLILANQRALKKEDLIGYASQLGLDRKQFAAALEERAFKSAVESDLIEAQKRGLRGVPVFYINEIRVDGLQPLALFKGIIDQELEKTNGATQ